MTVHDQLGARAAAVRDEAARVALLDALDAALEAIEVRERLIMWDRYHGDLTGDLDAASRDRGAILLDLRLGAALDTWAEQAADPLTRRRITQYRRLLALARVNEQPSTFERRNALDARIIAWRPRLGDREVDRATVREVLARDEDRERRRQAFAADAPLSQAIEGEMRALFEARNAAARAEGYPDYAELVLIADGLSKRWVRDLFAELDRLTEAPYRAALAQATGDLGLGQPEFWDLRYAFRRGAPPDELFPVEGIIPAIHTLARGLGVDPERLPIRVVFRDIPFGGLCMPVRVPDDIRILANPRPGQTDYWLMFHEYGHALHAAFNAQTHFGLKREPPPFNEGMAQTFGYFAHDPDWLREQTPLSEAAVADFTHHRMAAWLYHLRSLMAIATWELAAYEDPAQDLDALRAEHEARYLLVPPAVVPRWAVDSWLTMYPVYVQNYVIADVIASQTHRALRHRFGRLVGTPEVADALRTGYWAPGGSIDWQTKIEHLTGEPLTAAALAADLTAPA